MAGAMHRASRSRCGARGRRWTVASVCMVGTTLGAFAVASWRVTIVMLLRNANELASTFGSRYILCDRKTA